MRINARPRKKKAEPLAGVAALYGNPFGDLVPRSVIPADWETQAIKAWQYYREEPLVANAVNAWRTFALGDEITVLCDDADIQYEAQTAFWRLGLNDWIKDMILQLLVTGDAVGYFVRSAKGDDISRVICVNPVSVKLNYENDVLVEVIQHPISPEGGSLDPIPLALDQLIQLKWNSPEFERRGNSMVLPAFEAIELLRDYRRAERAIAKRWATPLRFIQVGGAYAGRVIAPTDQMIRQIREEMSHMDLESGMVVPFYVKAETYGTEGLTLNTEEKSHQVREDILVALSMARSIVTGDGPNFATASVSMQKMQVMLKDIKQAARDLLDWVFDEWAQRQGYEEYTLHYQFSDLDLNAEVDQKRVLIDLYDRGLVSKATLQQKMGLSPEVEERRSKGEGIVVDRNWSVQEITQLVALEVLTVDEARKRLGIDQPVKQAKQRSEVKEMERIYARHEIKR